ncbi:MAG: type I DNA topoisomerase [Bacteroidia bacterium]|nr:type I DNA topoisomerase [Bacteroidia bacterium]
MSKNLVIVESPAKAKTIEKFLGKDYTVKSCFGHIRDLVKKGHGVDIENNFKPTYEIQEDKIKIIEELKKLSKKSEMVWLASDEDREGEAISWHLSEVLELDPKKTKRIVFHEITKPAIEHAIKHPRGIDFNLVNAQQARRILDRLVGFELSPVLWKKVKTNLSAGRVQSVAVRLIVEREREIQQFKPETYFKVTGHFEINGIPVKAELNEKFKTEKEAVSFLEKIQSKDSFNILSVEKKPGKRSPSAPFTTSTLQQEASRKLGFSVSQTMLVAQRLYEAGKITYMRTDSVNLSETALKALKDVIGREFGNEYHQERQYKTKSKSAQEAHEAIRPTYPETKEIDGDANEKKLYELIWKRSVASQMKDAEIEKTIITIESGVSSLHFIATGEVVVFDGFLKLYEESTDDESDENSSGSGRLPKCKVGDIANWQEIQCIQRFTHHPPRYTEAGLVKKLEELGIGRPSTYAPTISTIQKRNYVEKASLNGTERSYYEWMVKKGGTIQKFEKKEITGADRNKLIPTDIGMMVNDFLVEYFPQILDYGFTAKVEDEFDEIANGNLEWVDMLKAFYKPFHKTVEKALDQSERVSGERLLGTDPASGKPVIARLGKYGPIVQIGSSEDEEKPKFASLRKDQRIETITLEEALELFKLPRVLGEFEGKEVRVNIGRFGPYILHDNVFTSLGKEDDPYSITLERCIELIELKRIKEKEKIIRIFKENPDWQILKGRWGPYVTDGKKNYKFPKNADPLKISLDELLKEIGAGNTENHRPDEKASIKKAKKTSATSSEIKEKKTAKKTVKKKKSTAKES